MTEEAKTQDLTAGELKSAIKILAARISSQSTPDEALKFTQAALNLAHTAEALDLIN